MQEITSIIKANASAPQDLAALLQPYMYLLELDPVEYAAAFAEGVLAASVVCLHTQSSGLSMLFTQGKCQCSV